MIRKVMICLALLPLTACASTGRVHDKDYLRAVSLNGTDAKTLTMTFFMDDSRDITVTGGDIVSALEAAELECGRPIFTGYTELVLLDGEDSFEELEYILKEWKVSPSCIVTYGRGDVFRDKPAEVLAGSVKQAVKQGEAPDSGIVTVLGELLREGEAEVAWLTGEGVCGTHILKKAADH